ncbi:MAG: OsmC family protein [Salaquimonas sp.]
MALSKSHIYEAVIEWTGNSGTGTSAYKAYERTWDLSSNGKPIVNCSNDPVLGGDASKYNPEDLFLSAIASCHMLWYLHLCSEAGVVVQTYRDEPQGIGEMEPSGKGRFTSVTLRPIIGITKGSDLEKAYTLHNEIHQYCFIARSVNFPVNYEPQITING